MSIDALESSACLYWPADLAKQAAEISSLGPLLETQDEFISVLTLASSSPLSWMEIIKLNKKLTPNLFLKHLMVLSDIGGERLQRFGKDFHRLFPTKSFNFTWQEGDSSYQFSPSGSRTWSNKNLRVEKSLLLEDRKEFTNEMKDVCMLLLWGSTIKDNDNLPVEMLEKCVIGNMLGDPESLKKFIKQRYIIVSRQTGGSTANDLGHICEEYIKQKIISSLPKHIELGGHNIEGISHNNRNLITFDLVAKNNNTKKHVGIEISFQVTTNSTIERKAGLAKSRKDLMHSKGHKIAYVIDGSGNFQRRNAINSILQYSDCTVNFSDKGLSELVNFITEGTK